MLFVTQALLCAIFWQFGGKLEALNTQETDEPEPLLVQDVDDEAELQARIWNAFNIEKRQSDELTRFAESFKAIITLEHIKNPNRRKKSQNMNETLETEGSLNDGQQIVEE